MHGQRLTALNGGPVFKFNEAVSFQVMCQTQEEIDYFWNKLPAGGDKQAQQCGWLKDKFGLSWQVAPTALAEMLADPDREKAYRVMEAMMPMKKIEIADLERAYEGASVTSRREGFRGGSGGHVALAVSRPPSFKHDHDNLTPSAAALRSAPSALQ